MDEKDFSGELAAKKAIELVESYESGKGFQADSARSIEEEQKADLAKSIQAMQEAERKSQEGFGAEDVPENDQETDPDEGVSDILPKVTLDDDPDLVVPEDEDGKPKKKRKKKWIVLGIIFGFLASMYLTFVFAPIPFVRKWRNIYIETAMSTTHHKWLATWFIPHWIIDEVMEALRAAREEQKTFESKWSEDIQPSPSPEPVVDPREEFFKKYWELNTKSFKEYLDKNSIDTEEELNNIKFKDLDWNMKIKTKKKDKVLACDTKNNLVLVGVEGSGYVGKLAIVKEPEQVCVGKSRHLGSRGEIIDRFGENYNALLAINASGFTDVGGHGSGGDVKGALVIDGVDYGKQNIADSKFFGMKKSNNKFYILNPWNVDASKYRWGVQFFPALVVDGKCVVAGTYGLGIQPRTAVGQAKDGTFLMLVVDGRQIGYSLGCTMEECAKTLIEYKVFQAANLDGGSSSIMWYDGAQITRSSSPSGFGRYLPDALYVKKAKKK